MKLLKFLPNRVWRVYQGGACIDTLRGEAHPQDNAFPEEWIASTVPARNPQHNVPREGLTQVLMPDGGTRLLADLLKESPAEILGPEHPASAGCTPGFLTKLLDSAIRLPIQAHPDREDSRRLFQSSYGKAEAWIVLGGRTIHGEAPYLLMGFNEKFDWDVFYRESMSGKMEKSLEMMHRYPIVPGEVIFIPGGFPHAIGSGVFVQEIMEPSDWVVQPEDHCGEQPLTENDRFCGIAPDEAMEVFHHEILTMEQLRARVLRIPKVLLDNADAKLTCMLDRKEIQFFGSMELCLHGRWRRGDDLRQFMACTVLEGNAILEDGMEKIQVRAGDTFGIAATAAPCFSGKARILMALPPVK